MKLILKSSISIRYHRDPLLHAGHEAREADVQADRLRQPPADDAADGGRGLRLAQGNVPESPRGRGGPQQQGWPT